VKHWDVAIIGGGVIGLSLALRLKEQSLTIIIVEKREPAGEATHAAGGMIAHCDPHTPKRPPAIAESISLPALPCVRCLRLAIAQPVSARHMPPIMLDSSSIAQEHGPLRLPHFRFQPVP